MPFRPKRSDTPPKIDVSGLKLNGGPESGRLDAVAVLEAQVNGL